jgi:hypothetical protein
LASLARAPLKPVLAASRLRAAERELSERCGAGNLQLELYDDFRFL